MAMNNPDYYEEWERWADDNESIMCRLFWYAIGFVAVVGITTFTVWGFLI